MDFGTGTARSGIAHFPEIRVGVKAHDAVIGKPRHILPDLPSFIVILVNRREQAFLRKFPDFGQKLPRPGNRFLLVIIAERPVSEHFEKSVVVIVPTDDVQIVVLARNADALLAVADALPALRIVAEKNRLELVHAGICKHERRIVVRNHGRRADKQVSLGFKELDKGFANLRGSHRFGHNDTFGFFRLER